MAYTDIAVSRPTEAPGINVAETAVPNGAGNGLKFLNDGKTILYFRNTTASPITLTIQTGATLGGYAVADPTAHSVPGSATNHGVLFAGPFPPSVFNLPPSDADAGKVKFGDASGVGVVVIPIGVG